MDLSSWLSACFLGWLLLVFPPDKPQKMSSIAPSLPELSSAQEDQLDELIDRFIQYDTGKLGGVEGRKALREFEALGTEAIPALIRGLNRAANIEHSCPVLVISRKLHKMLMASMDPQLLDFAHDEIGAGVTRSGHARVLADMRVQCMLRRNALVREQTTSNRMFATLKLADLIRASESEKGTRQKQILTEIQKRQGPEVMMALARATTDSDQEIGRLAVGLLDQYLERQPQDQWKQAISNKEDAIRKSAIRLAARHPELIPDVIQCLEDEQSEIQLLAHSLLIQINRGKDLGTDPKPWREWWSRQRR